MAPRTAGKPASSSSNPTGNQWYQTLDVTEVERRIDGFISGAEDIVNTFLECPACLYVFVQALLNNETLLKWVFLWRPGFFDTALRLIILLKDISIPALRIRLGENQRNCKHKTTTHKGPMASRTTDAVDTLLDALFTLICGALKLGPNPLFLDSSLNRKHFCRRKGKWPHALTDLFPVGLDRTLDSLVFWVCVPFGHRPFELLHVYMIVARPVIADALLTGTRRERLAWAILQALTSTRAAPPWPAGKPAPFAPPVGLRVARELCGRRKMVGDALLLLGVIRAGADARRDDAPRFVAGLEVQFLRAIDGIPDEVVQGFQVGDIEGDTIVRYICMLADHRFFDCPFAVPERAHAVLTYLRRIAAGYRCAGPGCSRHELEGLGENEEGPMRFPCCSKCQITRYCNVTCQRADWERTTGSHKDVCRILGRLTGSGVDILGEDFKLFTAAYEKLQEADAEALFQAAASASFVPHNRHLASSL